MLGNKITIFCYFKKDTMKQLGHWEVSPCRWYGILRSEGTGEKQAPISDGRRWNILGRWSFVQRLDCVVLRMIFWDPSALGINSSTVWEESLLCDPFSTTSIPFRSILSWHLWEASSWYLYVISKIKTLS